MPSPLEPLDLRSLGRRIAGSERRISGGLLPQEKGGSGRYGSRAPEYRGEGHP
jgi:hypothetical protein